jgi:hypothetical protein
MNNTDPLMTIMTGRQRPRRLLILMAFLAFPVTMFYFSPAMIFKGVRQGIVPGSLLVFFMLFLTALTQMAIRVSFQKAGGVIQTPFAVLGQKEA